MSRQELRGSSRAVTAGGGAGGAADDSEERVRLFRLGKKTTKRKEDAGSASESEDDSGVLKSGYLFRRGSNKQMKRRWFELTDTKLRWRDDARESLRPDIMKNTVDLYNVAKVSELTDSEARTLLPCADEESHRYLFSLELAAKSKDDVFVLGTPSEIERSDWIVAIRRQIARLPQKRGSLARLRNRLGMADSREAIVVPDAHHEPGSDDAAAVGLSVSPSQTRHFLLRNSVAAMSPPSAAAAAAAAAAGVLVSDSDEGTDSQSTESDERPSTSSSSSRSSLERTAKQQQQSAQAQGKESGSLFRNLSSKTKRMNPMKAISDGLHGLSGKNLSSSAQPTQESSKETKADRRATYRDVHESSSLPNRSGDLAPHTGAASSPLKSSHSPPGGSVSPRRDDGALSTSPSTGCPLLAASPSFSSPPSNASPPMHQSPTLSATATGAASPSAMSLSPSSPLPSQLGASASFSSSPVPQPAAADAPAVVESTKRPGPAEPASGAASRDVAELGSPAVSLMPMRLIVLTSGLLLASYALGQLDFHCLWVVVGCVGFGWLINQRVAYCEDALRRWYSRAARSEVTRTQHLYAETTGWLNQELARLWSPSIRPYFEQLAGQTLARAAASPSCAGVVRVVSVLLGDTPPQLLGAQYTNGATNFHFRYDGGSGGSGASLHLEFPVLQERTVALRVSNVYLEGVLQVRFETDGAAQLTGVSFSFLQVPALDFALTTSLGADFVKFPWLRDYIKAHLLMIVQQAALHPAALRVGGATDQPQPRPAQSHSMPAAPISRDDVVRAFQQFDEAICECIRNTSAVVEHGVASTLLSSDDSPLPQEVRSHKKFFKYFYIRPKQPDAASPLDS